MQQELLSALESTALKPYVERLREFLDRNPELRACVRELGAALATIASDAASKPTAFELPKAPPPPPEPVAAPMRVAPAPAASAEPSEPVSVLVSRLDIGSAAVVAETPLRSPGAPDQFAPAGDEDLPLIAERCRLKTIAVKWAAERQRRGGEGFTDDLASRYGELVARAQMKPDCYLWMCRSDFALFDPTQYDVLAGCFEAAAEAAEVLNDALSDPDRTEPLDKVFHLAAETQSALRVAVEATSPYHADFDQRRLFHWLRSGASQRGVWISRYMKLDDSADPSKWPDLIRRWNELRETVSAGKDKDKRRKKNLKKVRYLMNHRRAHPESDRLDDWKSAIQAVTELVADGLPPSNTELRDALMPCLEDLPGELEVTKEFSLVLKEIDRWLALKPPEAETAEAEPEESEEVRQAAKRLRGKTVVIIGGVKRWDAAEALEKALGLKELVWVEGRDQSYYTFESQVARPDVAVILLAIRWSRHGFSDVKKFCDQYGKLLVRLPTGYNPNIVAHHIMSQVGDRL
jgi:hypothetical protein